MVKVDITNVKKKSKIVRKNKKVYAKKEQSTTAKMLALQKINVDKTPTKPRQAVSIMSGLCQ